MSTNIQALVKAQAHSLLLHIRLKLLWYKTHSKGSPPHLVGYQISSNILPYLRVKASGNPVISCGILIKNYTESSYSINQTIIANCYYIGDKIGDKAIPRI